MVEKLHEPIYKLEDIAIKAERARACCNLALESFQDELKHLPDGGGWLSEVLLTLHLASDAYFEVEKELNSTFEELFKMYRQLREEEREPSRAEPSRAEPSRAEPSRAEPSRAYYIRPGFVRGWAA